MLAGKISPDGQVRHRLPTSQEMIFCCSGAVKWRGMMRMSRPTTDAARPMSPATTAVTAPSRTRRGGPGGDAAWLPDGGPGQEAADLCPPRLPAGLPQGHVTT